MLLSLLAGCGAPAPADPAFERVTFVTVPSFDGHNVPVTIYRPDGATPEDPVPLVLHSHGWGGSRETRLEGFRAFTDAGLAVVSIDMRGHGEARGTSQSHVANPDFEGRDVRAVIDYVATLTWVQQESSGDPVLGAMGESYGGAFALLAAAFDLRVDAIVAENTWNDLANAMAPNGVPKTAWFASLWLSGAIQGRIHADVRTGFEQAVQRGALPDGSQAGESDLAAMFRASSPANYPGQVGVPALFIQGVNDTLFDSGQAASNYALAQDGGATVAFVTHLGGHSLGSGPRSNRTETGPFRTHPCGASDELALSWFQAHLLDGSGTGPPVCVTLDDGTTVRAASYPLPGQDLEVEASPLRVQLGNVSSRDSVDVLVVTERTLVVGTPRLTGTLPIDHGNGTLYWLLEAVDSQGGVRRANGQVAPQRVLSGGTATFEIDLAPVSLHLREGETLRLAVAAHDSMFASPRQTAPAAIHVTGIRLALPLVCEACISYST